MMWKTWRITDPSRIAIRDCSDFSALHRELAAHPDPLAFLPVPTVEPNDTEAIQAGLRDVLGAQSTQSAVIIPMRGGEKPWGWPDHWLPVAVRWAPLWRQAAIVFLRPQEVASRLQDVSDPLWEILIRLADEQSLRLSDTSISLTPPASESDEALPALVPKRPGKEHSWLYQHIIDAGIVRAITSEVEQGALRAGLLQVHDYLDESHECSQEIEGRGPHRSGDYWHAIMHRREPDYGNSKYWFRRVGTHPVFAQLAQHADAIVLSCEDSSAASWRERLGTPDAWDPYAFVDMCQHCARQTATPLELAARRIQWMEMQLLLEHCCHAALG